MIALTLLLAALSGVFSPVPPFVLIDSSHGSISSPPQGMMPPFQSGTSKVIPGQHSGIVVTKPTRVVLAEGHKLRRDLVVDSLCYERQLHRLSCLDLRHRLCLLKLHGLWIRRSL